MIEKIHFENVEQQPEKEKEPMRLFVEIGPYNRALSHYGSRKFEENDVYVGVDTNLEALKSSREMTEVIRPENKGKFFFVQGDAQELPLKDSSADEIHFGNVLGHPRLKPYLNSFVGEAARILKEDGVIVIKESYTPLALQKLAKTLKTNSLVVEKFISKTDPLWPEEMKKYDYLEATSSIFDPDSYIAYLKKIKAKNK